MNLAPLQLFVQHAMRSSSRALRSMQHAAMQACSTSKMASLAAAWAAYIHCRGGRAVSVSTEMGRLEEHLDADDIGAASHVVLLPRCSAQLLASAVKAGARDAATRQAHRHVRAVEGVTAL
jgi:hypothetical protein